MADKTSSVELQVMWNRLIAVVDEQAQALMHTAFSPIVRESGDISAGVFAVGEAAATDINGDGTVDTADVAEWLSSAATENGLASPYLDGDANLDGSVNAEDLNAMAVNWQTSGKVWSTGDFTGEGDVNAPDLNALAINWQQSVPAAAAVPEPSGLILTLILLMTSCLMIDRRNAAHNCSLDSIPTRLAPSPIRRTGLADRNGATPVSMGRTMNSASTTWH